jgi:hypothetical protein
VKGKDKPMKLQKLGRIAFVLVGLLLITSIGQSVKAEDAKPASYRLYTGRVTGMDIQFVGIAIIDGNATIYICDGQADKGTVSIAEWFVGSVIDNAVKVTAPSGNIVEATLTDTTADGKFTFKNGTVAAFSLQVSNGDTALYRSEFTVGAIKFVGGWLVLPDGSIRGAVFNSKTGELTSATFQGPPLIAEQKK